ncbi:MAG: polysaccharide biosynthesis tyrosine autokinase [Clostridia bacterium]|nr:polysaccharide biosynthesis tyrosine autokinase [Clostridia bacterium]
MEEKIIRLDEINIHALILLILKNILVVIAICIGAVLCYSSFCKVTYSPRYTSTATFMVSAKDGTSAYNSLTTTQSMATVFVEVFQSNVLREKIVENMPDKKFDGVVNTTTIPETNLLIVSVTSPQPNTSFIALNLLIDNYSSISDYIFANAQLEVIKDPVVPIGPSNPLDISSKYLIVVFISGILAVVGIVVIYLFKDTLKTPKCARRRIDAKLLRTVDFERQKKTLRSWIRKKKSALLINGNLISKSFIEQNMSICSAVDYHARKRNQKIIMVTSVGENEGKSTVASNLALAMAGKNKKVVLLDCDFRKPSIHKIFDIKESIEGSDTLTDFLMNDKEESFSKYITVKRHGVTLCTSKKATKSINKLLNNGKLHRLLKALSEHYDYVIVDTPPMLAAADTETIAPMVDTVMLVARVDYMPTSSVIEGVERLRKSAPDFCGYVLNDYLTKLW